MKRLLMMAMVAMSVVTGAQAHGSGYWGPDVQNEIVRQSLETGSIDIDSLSDEEVTYIARNQKAPARTLKSVSLCRWWLKSLHK
jgi:hypothetical protein